MTEPSKLLPQSQREARSLQAPYRGQPKLTSEPVRPKGIARVGGTGFSRYRDGICDRTAVKYPKSGSFIRASIGGTAGQIYAPSDFALSAEPDGVFLF